MVQNNEAAKSDKIEIVRLYIKEVAQEKMINRYQIAKISGIDYQIIDYYWKNERYRYDRDIILKLCKALKCVPGDIIRISVEPSGE